MMAVKNNKAKRKIKQKWTKPVAGVSFPYYDEEGKRYLHSMSEEELRENGAPESLIKKVKDYQVDFIRQVTRYPTKEEEDEIIDFLNS